MKTLLINVCTLVFMLLFCTSAVAHGRWLIPSHTVLSGDEPEYITLDVSISNEIFYPDYSVGGFQEEKIINKTAEMRKLPPPIRSLLDSTRLKVIKPDGSVSENNTLVDFHRKSVASLLLDQNGSYRISVEQNPIYFTWFKHSDGELGRQLGKPEQVKKMLPEGAKNIRVTKLFNTVEAFVSRNSGSVNALSTTGEGLELKFHSHPNELFVGESLSLTVLYRGKVIEGIGVRLVKNGTRYRNDREVVELKSGEQGVIKLHWKKPGLYLLELEYDRESEEPGVLSETHANYVVLEVFPE